jgi:hypothetical protein
MRSDDGLRYNEGECVPGTQTMPRLGSKAGRVLCLAARTHRPVVFLRLYSLTFAHVPLQNWNCPVTHDRAPIGH